VVDLYRANEKVEKGIKIFEKGRNVTDHITKMLSLLQNVSPSKKLSSAEKKIKKSYSLSKCNL
jgi:hypothetical protein